MIRRSLFLIAPLLALAGCGGDDITRTFGLVRDTPDEFTVTTRAPLAMPPGFTLRAPEPGAPRPQERSATAAAEAALVPQASLETAQAVPNSFGQQAMLAASGPQAPANIRAQIDADKSLDSGTPTFVDKLMFWRTPPQPGVVADPEKEAQRIRENAALGQSVEQGDTPIIQRNRNSIFNSIF